MYPALLGICEPSMTRMGQCPRAGSVHGVAGGGTGGVKRASFLPLSLSQQSPWAVSKCVGWDGKEHSSSSSRQRFWTHASIKYPVEYSWIIQSSEGHMFFSFSLIKSQNIKQTEFLGKSDSFK